LIDDPLKPEEALSDAQRKTANEWFDHASAIRQISGSPDQIAATERSTERWMRVSYTQWEAWLALYHRKLSLIARATETAEREPQYRPTGDSRSAQDAHVAHLKEVERYPGCTFAGADSLVKYVLGSAVLDLLVRTYAERSGVSGCAPVTPTSSNPQAL